MLTFVSTHLLALAAPFTFSWYNLQLCLVSYFLVGCLGIDVSFHRWAARHRLSLSQTVIVAGGLPLHGEGGTAAYYVVP